MKILVPETGEEVDIYIYGVDGDEHTRDFFEKYFLDDETICEFEDYFLKLLKTDADFVVDSDETMKELKEMAVMVQSAIDDYVLLRDEGCDMTGLDDYIV